MASFEGFPIVVGWELTLECNLRCGHCASAAGISRVNELSVQEALAICDQFPSLLVQEVDFTGGEPLLSPLWPVLAERLTDLQIPVRMVSNGILLKEKVPALKEAGITTLGVSLDGMEANHDRNRRSPGLFKKAVEGIEDAVSAGISIAVITAVNSFNIADLPELHGFLSELGVKQWQLQPTFSLGRAREEGGPRLTESCFLELGKFIHDRIPQGQSGGLEISQADGVGYFTDLDLRRPAWTGCSAGLSSCGITSDGKIKGCLSMPDNLVEGDLRKKDFWSIWFDEKSFDYNRHFSPGDLGAECFGCRFGEQCRGGCNVMSYSATGRFHNDPYCFCSINSRCETRAV